MTTAFVLMTALPPTIGHLHLIEFAHQLADHVKVIVTTQPEEPYAIERYRAVWTACSDMPGVRVENLHATLEQDPNAEGFWPMWDNLMRQYGFRPGDLVVSSEPYGATLASRLDGIFMPYDPNRELYYTKATNIRNNPTKYFADILPEFQNVLRLRVTFFGAESTGKSTLSEEISRVLNGHWLFEYARPYLKTVGTEITVKSMRAIWKGQLATQRHAENWENKPYIFQDTDLFSTVGYWEQDHWKDMLGPVPEDLLRDARGTKSDLYIITPSNIPFEHDDIRYGGDVRENTDQYWIDLAEREKLNYLVLDSANWFERMSQSRTAIESLWKERADSLWYDRKGL